MGINPVRKFSQLINNNLPKTEPIVFDAAIAQKLCNRIDGIQLYAHSYSLIHNLTHGSLKPTDALEFAYQHEELKSTEIVQMLKEVDHPRINALFDFTNMINAYEQPLPALRIMAPYTRQVHLKGAKAIKEGKGYGQAGVVQGSVEDEVPYARMLYELLMLGETKPQMICFALEQKVNYYAPAYRRADEGENPIIPLRKPSETPYNEADGERILLNERRWASNQVNFIKRLLAEMHWLATLYLEINKKEISQNGQQSCFSPF